MENNTSKSGSKKENQSAVGKDAFNPVKEFVLIQPYHSMVRDGYFTFSLSFTATVLSREFIPTRKSLALCKDFAEGVAVSAGDVLAFARRDDVKKPDSKTKSENKGESTKKKPQSSLIKEDFASSVADFNERSKEVAIKIGTSVIGRIRQRSKITEDSTVQLWWGQALPADKLFVLSSEKYRKDIIEIDGWEEKVQQVACPFRDHFEIRAPVEKDTAKSGDADQKGTKGASSSTAKPYGQSGRVEKQ